MVARRETSQVHIAWSGGAPTLVSGFNMAAPGNPGGTSGGQIQLNFTSGTPSGPAVNVTGTAGPGSYFVAPQDTSGLIKVFDAAGVAVNFGSTTGFVLLSVVAELS